MESIRQYIISVICACIIVCLLTSLCGKKLVTSEMIKLISGIFIVLTMVAPIVKVELGDLNRFYIDISADGQAAIAEGENMARESVQAIIKEQLETYILDKASSLGLDVTVALTLNDSAVATPDEIIISGSASPYGRKMLQSYLVEQIGIAEEKQIWK